METPNHSTKKRRLGIISFIMSLIIIISAITIISAPVSAQTAIIAKTQVNANLRTGAGTEYSRIQMIEKNTYVTIVDKSRYNWYKIKLGDGTTGYCSASSLDIITDCKTTDCVNFRSGPGTNYKVYYTLSPSTRLDIISFKNDSWAQVRNSSGTIGYICTDYVEYVNDASTTTAVRAQAPAFSISETSRTAPVGLRFRLTVKGNSGTVTWDTSDKKVAVVVDGVVRGRKAGTADITATDSKTKQVLTCRVEVVDTEYYVIKLSDKTKKLEIGQNFKLTAETTPEGGKYKLTSSDPSVATVSDDGQVIAVDEGKAVITASDSTGVVNASCTVTVEPKGSISLDSSSVSVNAGASVTVGITKTPSNLGVKWTSSNTNVASVRNGRISGLREGTAVITASDESGKVKASCTVYVSAVSKGNVRLSRYSGSLETGKTLYIKGYNGSKWTTSDSSVATVWDGFITAKSVGRAAISYVDYYGNRAIFIVNVTDPAPVRFGYSSPNSATLSSKITLVAITDKKHSDVYFVVKDGANPTTVQATSKTAEGDTYIWKATYTPTKAGVFIVRAYSKYNGVYKTCDDGKFDIYISDKQKSTTTALEKLRASDQVIKNIGDMEGFVSSVTYDTLAGNIPTLGHGVVVWEGDKFYNNLTRGEAFAWLIKTVNENVFTTRVNEMLINNGIRFNQQQFDALVSFSYNCGTGWTYSSDIKNILLNSYGYSSSGTGTMKGKVTAPSGLYLRSGSTTSSGVIETLDYNETVTLVSTTKYNGVWYKVKTQSGNTGYCSGTYLNVYSSGGSGYVRDLNNVNRNALIKELLSYHHAGRVCYYGLLYRRADELEMFLYGDYKVDGRSNKYNFPDPSCISFP